MVSIKPPTRFYQAEADVPHSEVAGAPITIEVNDDGKAETHFVYKIGGVDPLQVIY